MRVEKWDRKADAFGVSAAVWTERYGVEGGHLLFVVDDAGTLVLVVPTAPGGGRVPITDDNYDDVVAAVLAELEPAEQPEPPAGELPVTRAEFDQLRADLDWTINYAVTGEA